MNFSFSFTGPLTVGDLSGTFQGSLSGTLAPASPPPPPAGPSLRGEPTTGTGGTVTLPAHQTGDVLIVFAAFANGANAVSPSGWTVDRNQAATVSLASRGYLFTRTASSPADTIDFGAFASSCRTWTAYPVKDATGVDTSASGNGSTASPSCPTVSPSVAPTLLIDCVIANTDDGATTIMMPSGETAAPLVDHSGVSSTIMRCGHKTLAAIGDTGARAATLDEVGANVTLSVVIK